MEFSSWPFLVPTNPLTHSQEAVVLVVVVVERVVIPASPGDTKMGRSGSPRSYLINIYIYHIYCKWSDCILSTRWHENGHHAWKNQDASCKTMLDRVLQYPNRQMRLLIHHVICLQTHVSISVIFTYSHFKSPSLYFLPGKKKHIRKNHPVEEHLQLTLPGISISHLGKRKIIFKSDVWWDMLVPWRVTLPVRSFSFLWSTAAWLRLVKATLESSMLTPAFMKGRNPWKHLRYGLWLKSGVQTVDMVNIRIPRYLQGFRTIPGGCLGFLPSTVGTSLGIDHSDSAYSLSQVRPGHGDPHIWSKL